MSGVVACKVECPQFLCQFCLRAQDGGRHLLACHLGSSFCVCWSSVDVYVRHILYNDVRRTTRCPPACGRSSWGWTPSRWRTTLRRPGRRPAGRSTARRLSATSICCGSPSAPRARRCAAASQSIARVSHLPTSYHSMFCSMRCSLWCQGGHHSQALKARSAVSGWSEDNTMTLTYGKLVNRGYGPVAVRKLCSRCRDVEGAARVLRHGDGFD